MPETLNLAGHDTVTVERADADALEVEARYAPGGSPPPKHLHPAQDEHFEVREGEMTTRVDGVERVLRAGDTLDIPRGTPHQMWNASDAPARVAWRTSPALRTLEWFRALDELHRSGRTGPRALAPLVNEYRDVFRLAVAPDALQRVAFAALSKLPSR
jgi:quercetin dioxygenase-like cupin family protein